MARVFKTAASLRFHSDDLDPSELSPCLWCEPTLGVKKDAIWVSRKEREIVATSCRWLLKTDDVEPGDIDQQIASLFSGLSDDLARWREHAHVYDRPPKRCHDLAPATIQPL